MSVKKKDDWMRMSRSWAKKKIVYEFVPPRARSPFCVLPCSLVCPCVVQSAVEMKFGVRFGWETYLERTRKETESIAAPELNGLFTRQRRRNHRVFMTLPLHRQHYLIACSIYNEEEVTLKSHIVVHFQLFPKSPNRESLAWIFDAICRIPIISFSSWVAPGGTRLW